MDIKKERRAEEIQQIVESIQKDLTKIYEILSTKEENPEYTEMQEKIAIGKILTMCNISKKKQCFLMFTEVIYKYSKLSKQMQNKKCLISLYKDIAVNFNSDPKTVNLSMKNELKTGNIYNSKTAKIFKKAPETLWEFVRDVTRFYGENKEYYIGHKKTIEDIKKLLNKLLKEDENPMPKVKKLKQSPSDMEKTIARILQEEGIHEHFVGYNALKQAIVIYLCNPVLNLEEIYTEVSVQQNVSILKVSDEIKILASYINSIDSVNENFNTFSASQLIKKICSRYLDEYYVI